MLIAVWRSWYGAKTNTLDFRSNVWLKKWPVKQMYDTAFWSVQKSIVMAIDCASFNCATNFFKWIFFNRFKLLVTVLRCGGRNPTGSILLTIFKTRLRTYLLENHRIISICRVCSDRWTIGHPRVYNWGLTCVISPFCLPIEESDSIVLADY